MMTRGRPAQSEALPDRWAPPRPSHSRASTTSAKQVGTAPFTTFKWRKPPPTINVGLPSVFRWLLFFSFGSAVELLLHPPTAFPLLCRMLSRHIFLFFMTDHYFLLRHPIKKPPKRRRKQLIACRPYRSVLLQIIREQHSAVKSTDAGLVFISGPCTFFGNLFNYLGRIPFSPWYGRSPKCAGDYDDHVSHFSLFSVCATRRRKY